MLHDNSVGKIKGTLIDPQLKKIQLTAFKFLCDCNKLLMHFYGEDYNGERKYICLEHNLHTKKQALYAASSDNSMLLNIHPVPQKLSDAFILNYPEGLRLVKPSSRECSLIYKGDAKFRKIISSDVTSPVIIGVKSTSLVKLELESSTLMHMALQDITLVDAVTRNNPEDKNSLCITGKDGTVVVYDHYQNSITYKIKTNAMLRNISFKSGSSFVFTCSDMLSDKFYLFDLRKNDKYLGIYDGYSSDCVITRQEWMETYK